MNSLSRSLRLLWLLILATTLTTPAAAQAPIEVLNVFLDCDECDHDFVRTEIKYVNWVRDRTVADLHVLASEEDTGGGGDRYTMTFTGLRTLVGSEDTLVFSTSSDDTPDQVRQAFVRVLSIGLVRFVAMTPAGLRQLNIGWAAKEAGRPPPKPAEDRWNFWVFTLGLNSYMNGEESQQFLNWNAEVEANRTTEQYKTSLELNGSFDRSSFTLTESGQTREVVSTQKYYSAEALAVRSLGPHWSVGATAEALQATFANVSFGFMGGPAVEYSFWPYAVATRRSFVIRYSPGIRSNRYSETTIYNLNEETRPIHSLMGELRLKQRWGSMRGEARFSQYLHSTKFYNLYTYGSADVRLFKGFSVNFYGSYSRIRDQLSLPQEELTPEEVLLRQQELSTGYRYYGGVGVRYSFGSIFNNVVNPRFE